MKTNESLNIFGTILMNDVRDNTISTMDDYLKKNIKSKRGILINKLMSSFSKDEINIIRNLIITTTDLCLFNFLTMFIENEAQMSIVVKNKNMEYDIVQESDGLNGELYSDSGWIHLFSKYGDCEFESLE